MLYKRTFPRLLLAFVLVAPSVLAQQAATERKTADEERLRAHVSHLASPQLEGRKTGTPGATAAAEYIGREFERYGLKPGGADVNISVRDNATTARTFFQSFPYVAAVELGKKSAMSATVPAGDDKPIPLRVGEDWMPLGFSANAAVEKAPVVFVGFGITAPELNHDDYRDGRARDRVALAFAGTPDGDNPHGRFTRAGELRFKAAAARAAGARALLIIAREENFREDKLARLTYDNGGDAGLPVAVISRQSAARALSLGPPSLSNLESEQRAALNAVTQADKEKLPDPVTVIAGPAFVSMTTDVVRRNAPAFNVVGVLEGADAKLREEVIVVGAHYDHLGRGGRGSLAAREG